MGPALLLEDIKAKALITREKEPALVDDLGNPIPWLLDLRPVFLSPVNLELYAAFFWENVAPGEDFQLAGMEVAAVPLLTALLMEGARRGRSVNGLVLRKERKLTGRGRVLEGIPTKFPVILVDDILNSGKSLDKCLAVLEAEGLTVAKAFVVVDFHSPSGERWRRGKNFPIQAMFTLDDVGVAWDGKAVPPPIRKYEFLWRFTAPGGLPFYTNPKSSPLLWNGTLYFGTDSALFYALDAATGAVKWTFAARGAHRKGIWSSPLVHEGIVYFGAYNGVFYALNAETGALVWQNPLCEWIGSSPCLVEKHGVLVVGLEYENPTAKGAMVALDLKTGEKRWEVKLREYQHGSAVYNPVADTVIFGTNDHTVVAADARTGYPVWKTPTARSIKYAPALHAERQLVAVIDFGGTLMLLKADSGQVVWQQPTPGMGYATPVFWGNRLYCGSGDRKLYVLDLDSLKLEEPLECGARVFASLRVVGKGLNQGLMVGTCGGRLYEYNPQNLVVTGFQALPDALVNAVAASEDGGLVYVPTAMNEIFAFRRS